MRLQDEVHVQCIQQKTEVSNLEDQLSKLFVYFHKVPFSPTKGSDQVNTSMKLGSQ